MRQLCSPPLAIAEIGTRSLLAVVPLTPSIHAPATQRFARESPANFSRPYSVCYASLR